ncbi:MFS transporter [Intrasporangium sp. YIM S08009]|uniref:MFS transporter n=1 Tax=Intrasporangium zincisolvens TaxID=3080018 RepID=UPI002B055743|nr:MFS transporter [Intrasporangium sp. YIM S08009]
MTAPALVGAPPPPLRRDRMVRTWVAAMFLSWFGDALWTVALAWTAAHTLSPAMAGVVLGAEMLPQAAFVVVGGVLADRYDTRRVLVVGRATQGVVLLAAAVAWASGIQGAGFLAALGVTLGVVTGLTMPSGATMARQLVESEDLATVSGWNQIGNRTARLLGAPAGGAVVAWSGPAGAMVIDAVTFLGIAATLGLVVRPRFALPRSVGMPWLASVRDGVAYLRRDDRARLLVLGLAALNVFISPVIALGVALRVTGSGWGPSWLGYAEAAFATGAIIGSLVGIRVRPARPARAGFRVLVAQGVLIVGAGVDARAVLLAAMLGIGLTAGAASVWLSGAYQRTVATSHLGRVSSLSGFGDLVLVPLAIPAFGAVAAATSVLTAAVACGLGMAGLCAWFATRRGIAGVR